MPTLARALFDGALIESFPGAGGPLALADATIYVPTQRAAAALARELVLASGGASLILPRIAPLGAFEPTREELGLIADDDALSEAAPPSVGELARRMTLARLVRAWGEALRGAIRGIDAEGRMTFDVSEPPLVATSPAQAFALSGDLAGLIDDFIIEDVAPERLETLVADRFDPYWGITLDFLKIAFALWPAWLAERGLVDRARRAALTIEAEVRALADGAARGPTIIAGSTGANRATARLIAAIARAPQGAVVLPDLDRDLDDAAWAMLGEDGDGAIGVAGHPQAILRRLLATIGVERGAVRPLGLVDAPRRARARFLTEALRPADSTDLWARRRDEATDDGLADVAIILAADENEEALALAAAMREALETPGRTAALITPDVAIARRVAAELTRWGIEIEASAGRTLGETDAGVLARLALAAAGDFSPLPLAALLANPLTSLGRTREAYQAAARALEIGVLRMVLPPSGLERSGGVDCTSARRRQRPLRSSGATTARRARVASRGSAARRRDDGVCTFACARRRGAAQRFHRRPPRRAWRTEFRRRRLARGAGRGSARNAVRRLERRRRPGVPLQPWRLRCAVRRRRRRRTRAPWPGGASASANPRPARSAAARLSISRCSPVSTRRSGRRPRPPTLSSIARCAPISACRRPSGASARPRMISSPRSARLK